MKFFNKQKFILLFNMAKMDFKKRYLGTLLGAVWAIILPLSTIALIYFVVAYGLKAGSVGEVSFVNWLVPGMLAWFFVSDCIANATNTFIEYSYLITKMRFPVSILIPARLCAAMPVHLLLIIIFMCLLLVRGEASYTYWPQLLYYFFCSVVLLLPLGMLFSTLQIFMRDTMNIVSVGIQMFFWATPLFWNPDLIQGTGLEFILFSPFNYIVNGYRDSLLFGIPFWIRTTETIVFWIICLIVTVTSLIVYKRTRPHFADVL